MKISGCFTVLCLLSLSLPAEAAISISNAIVDFSPNSRNVQDVMVTNRGDKTEYVNVELVRVVKPGDSPEQAETVAVDDTRLIIAPRKMVLPPGGRRSVRIINRHTTHSSDVVYRATVKPATADPLTANSKLGVKVVVAYGILIFVRPRNLNVSLDAKRKGNQVTFYNRGNTNIDMREGEQCGTRNRAQVCEELKGERLYPGKSHVLALPFDAPVKFNYKVAGETYSRVFP